MSTYKQDFVKALKFVSHAMGTQDVRYYLNGVYFEFLDNPRRLRLTASDGHRAARIELDLFEPCPVDVSYIAKAEDVKALLAVCKTTNSDNALLEFVRTDRDDHFQVVWDRPQSVMCIDGSFPDVARLKPKGDADGTPEFGLNAGYLADAAKAIKPFCGNLHSLKISAHKGNAPVTLEPPVIASWCKAVRYAWVVIMPVRL